MLMAASTLAGQSLIGLPKEEVKERISLFHREFKNDQMVVKQQFNYLKYVNGIRTRTWILYFTDDDICHISKLVCDYSEYDKVLDDLNATCRRVGDFTWESGQEGLVSELTLSKQEYYFTVREERKK
jgi:hypothetical protein